MILIIVISFVFLCSCRSNSSDQRPFEAKNVLFLKEGDPIILGDETVGYVSRFGMKPGKVLFYADWKPGITFFSPMKFQIHSSSNKDLRSFVLLIPERIAGAVFVEKYPATFVGWSDDQFGCYIKNDIQPRIPVDSSYFIYEGEIPWATQESKIKILGRHNLK